MRAPPHPQQEARLAALARYDILDTPRERDFDEIVELVARICDVPIAVINFIDAERQWFKAEVGLGVRETPLETSLCSHVILEQSFVEIPDTLSDPRMCDNPLCLAADGLRFYAGALLTSEEGLPVGTLCVLDNRPRELTDLQRDTIQVLARQVTTQLNLRRAVASEKILRNEIDHRVKNSLSSVAGFVALERRSVKDAATQQLLDRVGQQIATVALLHKQLSDAGSQRVDLSVYLTEVAQLVARSQPPAVTITANFDPLELDAREASVVGTIVNELAANAIKHSVGEDGGTIQIVGEAMGGGRYRLVCADDGPTADPVPEPGGRSGLGLRLIASSVRQLNGTVISAREPSGYRTEIMIASTLR